MTVEKAKVMRSTKVNVLTTLQAVIKKYGKKYCMASQERILELLEEFYDVKIRRRQLNYHLADLREMGYIKTIRRTHRNKDGTLCLETSAACITPKGYLALWKMGCEWAKKMYDRLMKKYCPKIGKHIKATPGPSKEEIARRRAFGREIFKTPEYRRAFSLDEPGRMVPNF